MLGEQEWGIAEGGKIQAFANFVDQNGFNFDIKALAHGVAEEKGAPKSAIASGMPAGRSVVEPFLELEVLELLLDPDRQVAQEDQCGVQSQCGEVYSERQRDPKRIGACNLDQDGWIGVPGSVANSDRFSAAFTGNAHDGEEEVYTANASKVAVVGGGCQQMVVHQQRQYKPSGTREEQGFAEQQYLLGVGVAVSGFELEKDETFRK